MANDQQSSSTCLTALAEPEKTRCVACKQEIPRGASICSVCKSYQSSWKNTVQYVAGLVTLLVLIVTACTWLWGAARTTLFYRDDVPTNLCQLTGIGRSCKFWGRRDLRLTPASDHAGAVWGLANTTPGLRGEASRRPIHAPRIPED